MSRKTRETEAGVALITVFLIGLIALALSAAMITYALTSTPLARKSQDWNASLSSAESGVDDFLYRLGKDSEYGFYSSTNPPVPANPAFSGFTNVAGGSDEKDNQGKFKYDVVQPPTTTNGGLVKLKVIGQVNKTQRTFEAFLRRRSFLDFLYFTDFETKDPLTYDPSIDGNTSGGVPQDTTWAGTNCGDRYGYDLTVDPGVSATTSPNIPARNSECTEIRFISNDTIRGPLHSNDRIRIDGNPTFLGDTSTNWNDTAGKRWVDVSSGSNSNPTFKDGPWLPAPVAPAVRDPNHDPKFKQTLKIPPSNQDLLNDATTLGCVYTGPTKITFDPAGTISVVSPWTQDYYLSGLAAGCYANGTAFTPPRDRIIYVKTAPAACPYAVLGAGSGGGHSPGIKYPPGLPVPIVDDLTNGTQRAGYVGKYDCRNGDVFISGVVNGKLTIGAENDIVVAGDVTYQNTTAGSDDLLGLIPQNSVKVIHPVDCRTGTCVDIAYSGFGSDGVTSVSAAMLAVGHAFTVQNYSMGGPRGTLSVFGAIAQKYRGPVGTGSASAIATGYAKDYRYDDRLKLRSPPHFLDPVKAAWEIKSIAETKPNAN